MALQQHEHHIRHNFFSNVTDAAFFGLGMGISSFATVIPLFIATLTDSTVLIGLIAAMHTIGWQLPQVFTSNIVAKRSRFLPFVLWMTLHERWPFIALGFVCVALAGGLISQAVALPLAFLFVAFHSFGGGVTANAWQNMIGKIIPSRMRGTFYGLQSSASALLGSGGALLSGLLLATLPYPLGYAACFFITGIAMMISLGFLAYSHEDAHEVEDVERPSGRAFWAHLWTLFKRDSNFRWFVAARSLSQLAQMVLLVYIIYGTRNFAIGIATTGALASAQTLAQAVANPIMGRLGDLYGHRRTFALTNILLALSAVVAILAQSEGWFYVIFVLAGFVNSQWTVTLAMILEFGTEVERPYYIGLANTAIAPATLIAPVLGGALVSLVGFKVMFAVAIVLALASAGVAMVMLTDPRKRKSASWVSTDVAPAAIGD